MQEKNKNVSTVKFLSQYGDKILCGETYYPDDDQCDQRAPVNDPFDLYNQFVVPEDVMDELDSEKVEDFENDFYDYDDRTDLGIDILQASSLNLKELKRKKAKQTNGGMKAEDDKNADDSENND